MVANRISGSGNSSSANTATAHNSNTPQYNSERHATIILNNDNFNDAHNNSKKSRRDEIQARAKSLGAAGG